MCVCVCVCVCVSSVASTHAQPFFVRTHTYSPKDCEITSARVSEGARCVSVRVCVRVCACVYVHFS